VGETDLYDHFIKIFISIIVGYSYELHKSCAR
jgi:hypothetical protein